MPPRPAVAYPPDIGATCPSSTPRARRRAKAQTPADEEALAREVARKGVTVNSVSPGYCETALVMAMPQEIREGIACVKHQNMSGSDIGDDHKEYFAGEAALKAGGVHNTMNQFG